MKRKYGSPPPLHLNPTRRERSLDNWTNGSSVKSLVVWGDKLAEAREDGTINLWDYETGERETLPGGGAKTLAVCKGKLVGATDDGNVGLWTYENLKKERLRGEFSSFPRPRFLAAWNDKLLFTSSKTNIEQWDCEILKRERIFPGYEDVTSIVVWGDMMANGTNRGKIRVWDWSGRLRRMIDGHIGSIRALVVWNGKLISGGDDGMIRAWGHETDKCEKKVFGCGLPITSFVVWKNKLVVAFRNRSTAMWSSLEEGREDEAVAKECRLYDPVRSLVVWNDRLGFGLSRAVEFWGTRAHDNLMLWLCWKREESSVSCLPMDVVKHLTKIFI